jgi:hypothetical protein
MVVLYSLLLQGCRSGLHGIVEGSAVEQSDQTTGDHEQSADQVSAPDVQSSTSSEVPHRSLSTAGAANLPSDDRVSAPDVQSSTSSEVPHRSLSTAGAASLPSDNQVPAPDVQFSTSSEVPHRSPSIAGAASLSSDAMRARRLASMLATMLALDQVLVMDLESADAQPAARPFVSQATIFFQARRLASLRTRSFDVPTPVFGAQAWRRYFGEVGTEPPLPSDINQILSGPCPFWSGKSVQDTHLLVLIPSTVNGSAFTLNLLEELIKYPQGEGYPTAYCFYGHDVRAALGAQSPESAYWVLMTREVLPGSRGKDYASQKALIAAHASETGLAHELPGALEATTVILSHYVRTREYLYADSPWTWTRCRELVDTIYPVVSGGFSAGGLIVSDHEPHGDFDYGVASLRKF